MSNHSFNWNKNSYEPEEQYTGIIEALGYESPQNRIFINPRGGSMKKLRSAPGGVPANAQNRRERAGGRARHWMRRYI